MIENSFNYVPPHTKLLNTSSDDAAAIVKHRSFTPHLISIYFPDDFVVRSRITATAGP